MSIYSCEREKFTPGISRERTENAMISFIPLSAAIVASAMGGITAGFSSTTVPVTINQAYSLYEEEVTVPLITLSVEPLSRIRLEGFYGFRSATEKEEHMWTNEVVDSRSEAFGAAAFCTFIKRGGGAFSAGVRYLHSSTTVETEYDLTEFYCTMDRIGPAARIDISIPGLEEIGLYSQWGVDYTQTEIAFYSNEQEVGSEGRDEWLTSAPEYVVSGIYYSF